MKAQLSIEFVILIGMSLVMVIGFLAVINSLSSIRGEEKSQVLMEDLGQAIQQELILAARVNDGYERTFQIPPGKTSNLYNDLPFTINNTNSSLTVTHRGSDWYFKIPEIQGTLAIGDNTIRTRGNIIYVNE